MTYKLKLNQVREILGMEVKLEAAKLIDGVTMVEYERLEPGFPLFVIAEDGSTMAPAPAGEHKLEDGTTIEVDAAGMIIEVSKEEAELEEEEAPVAAEDVVEVSGEEVADVEKVDVGLEEAIIEKVEEKVAEKMKAIFEAVEEVAKEVAAVKEEMGAMKTKMEKFSKAPAATAIPKVTPVETAFDAFENKVAALKSVLKK